GSDDRARRGKRTDFRVLGVGFEGRARGGQLGGRLEALGKGPAQLASEFGWTEQLAAQSKVIVQEAEAAGGARTDQGPKQVRRDFPHLGVDEVDQRIPVQMLIANATAVPVDVLVANLGSLHLDVIVRPPVNESCDRIEKSAQFLADQCERERFQITCK